MSLRGWWIRRQEAKLYQERRRGLDSMGVPPPHPQSRRVQMVVDPRPLQSQELPPPPPPPFRNPGIG